MIPFCDCVRSWLLACAFLYCTDSWKKELNVWLFSLKSDEIFYIIRAQTNNLAVFSKEELYPIVWSDTGSKNVIPIIIPILLFIKFPFNNSVSDSDVCIFLREYKIASAKLLLYFFYSKNKSKISKSARIISSDFRRILIIRV